MAQEGKIKAENRKSALVTGGAGFIGSNLVDELINRGFRVVVLDNLVTGKRENVNPKAEFHHADIRNFEEIRNLFRGIDYVFHVAALPRIQLSIDDPLRTSDTNVRGTLHVLISARDAGVKKVVYSASSSVYGLQNELPWHEDMRPHPITPYGSQKYFGEVYCRLFSEIYGLPTVALRYFNVYGRRQSSEGAYCSVLGTFVKQRLSGHPLTIHGDGENKRDYTNVDDVVRANILAIENSGLRGGETINIGAGCAHSINDIAKMIGGPAVNMPARLEVKISLANNKKAKELLGWQPSVSFMDWLNEYKKEVGLD